MGLTEQLVGLLQGPQNSSRSHVINLFKTFVMDYPPAINDCQRPEFDLERLLSSIITSSMEDDPDAHEVTLQSFVTEMHNCVKSQLSAAYTTWSNILMSFAVLLCLINDFYERLRFYRPKSRQRPLGYFLLQIHTENAVIQRRN